MPHGARSERRPVSVLIAVQRTHAPPYVEKEGVGRFEVTFPGRFGRRRAQQFLRVLEVGGM